MHPNPIVTELPARVGPIGAPHGVNCAHCTARLWFASCVALMILSFTYLYGVLCAARLSVAWEACLTIGLPALSYLFFVSPEASQTGATRMRDLILIESSFNFLSVIAKVFIEYQYHYNQAMNIAFLLFFVLQTYGFISNEKLYRGNVSSIRSWTLFTQICMQRWSLQYLSHSDETANVIDAQGRLIVFGKNAPPNLILHYGFWLIGILYVDYGDYVSNSGMHVTHIASYLLSCLSGEFWHSRLLTASHLFVLDAILYFRNGVTVSAAPLAIMPRNVLAHYQRWLPIINWISFIGCLSCLTTTVICGGDKVLCMHIDATFFFQRI